MEATTNRPPQLAPSQTTDRKTKTKEGKKEKKEKRLPIIIKFRGQLRLHRLAVVAAVVAASTRHSTSRNRLDSRRIVRTDPLPQLRVVKRAAGARMKLAIGSRDTLLLRRRQEGELGVRFWTLWGFTNVG